MGITFWSSFWCGALFSLYIIYLLSQFNKRHFHVKLDANKLLESHKYHLMLKFVGAKVLIFTPVTKLLELWTWQNMIESFFCDCKVYESPSEIEIKITAFIYK